MADDNDSDDGFELPKERPKDHWNEDNWEKRMDEHPMFMTELPSDGKIPPLVEAMSQLKYDPQSNSCLELAINYKDDGNNNFKMKKYRWAIDAYSEGLKQKCPDNEVNSILYANRSAAHFHLGNHRSAINDANDAIKLNPNNEKAMMRIAQCHFQLKEYDKCVEMCRKHFNKEGNKKLVDLEKRALMEIRKVKRNERKIEADEMKRKIMEESVIDAVNSRGIKFKGSLFESIHPAAHGHHVILTDCGDLIWPVIFLYPEYGQCDFIEKFNENNTFVEHLNLVFAESPPWDVTCKYNVKNISIHYQSLSSGKIIPIEKGQKLRDVMSDETFVLVSAIPTFIACIKPVERNKDAGLVKTKVEVSLGDCLACSGCITSAESVLIAQQSHDELYRIIDENKANPNNAKIIAVSLSLQSIASIGVKYDLTMQETAEKLASFFVSIGADYVFDISLARHVSLIEAQNEFLEKFKNLQFPVLNSVCPGFVCYVEKTHGELLVPLLSNVKSPQQLMGVIVKRFLKAKGKQIYHVTIMPCYDKKLEATRGEFGDESHHIKEVDCVLTPIEIEVMLNHESVILPEICPRKLDTIIEGFSGAKLSSHRGSGSGGYCENIFRFTASKLFNTQFNQNQQFNYKTLRNKDFIELSLEDETGKTLLSFAIINGFRNIQTLVQRIKRKTCHYQYVEVMACPSGCLNGGAQLKGETQWEDVYKSVEMLYKSLEITDMPLDHDNDQIVDSYKKCFGENDDINELLYTKFKPVPKNLNLINVNW